MIDNVNIGVQIKPPAEVINQSSEPFYIHDLYFKPVWHDNGYKTYTATLDNLKLRILNDQLSIYNSWHKFYKGNNYSDYPLSEIEQTLYKLESKIGLNIETAKISKIAYGCVLKEDPNLNYPNWQLLRNRQPKPMYSGPKIYGCSFDFNDYKFKGYDKRYEVYKHTGYNLTDNYYRIEKEVKYMRHLAKLSNPINLIYTKDILNKDILKQLGDDLLNTYKRIEMKESLNLTQLSPKELQIVAVMQDYRIRDVLKKEHNRTYKRYLQQYKTLSKGQKNNYYTGFEIKLASKINDLING